MFNSFRPQLTWDSQMRNESATGETKFCGGNMQVLHDGQLWPAEHQTACLSHCNSLNFSLTRWRRVRWKSFLPLVQTFFMVQVITNKSNAILVLQVNPTQWTWTVIVGVLQPLQIRLNYALKYSRIKNIRFLETQKSNLEFTFRWLSTKQLSQTVTRWSKQKRLLTTFFGHLHKPISIWSN